MTTETELAHRATVLKLIKLYRYLDGKDTKELRALTDMYVEPVMRFSPTAVHRAYESIRDGGVEETKDWLPQVPRWVAEVQRFERPGGAVIGLYNGLIEMDFGHGRVDMRGLTVGEQDRVIDAHGVIDGKNLALLSLDEKQAVLRQEKIDGPAITPRLRTMRDK